MGLPAFQKPSYNWCKICKTFVSISPKHYTYKWKCTIQHFFHFLFTDVESGTAKLIYAALIHPHDVFFMNIYVLEYDAMILVFTAKNGETRLEKEVVYIDNNVQEFLSKTNR